MQSLTPLPAGALNCGFEDGWEPYCLLWTNEGKDQFDWTLFGGPTPSKGTGPDRAAEGQLYLYTETSTTLGWGWTSKSSKQRKENDTAILTTNRNIYLGPGASLKFQQHMHGHTVGSLKVLVDGNVVFEKNGDQGNQWNSQEVALEPYSGKSVVIKFVGTRGASYTGDIGIDDLALERGDQSGAPTTTTTKAPTTTLAPTKAPTKAPQTTLAPTATPVAETTAAPPSSPTTKAPATTPPMTTAPQETLAPTTTLAPGTTAAQPSPATPPKSEEELKKDILELKLKTDNVQKYVNGVVDAVKSGDLKVTDEKVVNKEVETKLEKLGRYLR